MILLIITRFFIFIKNPSNTTELFGFAFKYTYSFRIVAKTKSLSSFHRSGVLDVSI